MIINVQEKTSVGLFDATFDNLARAVIQISRYRQFLQSAETWTCRDWLELLSRATCRQGSHVYLAPWARQLCITVPQ